MELREDQTDALERLRKAVAEGKRRICMQAPTGFGKTVLAAALVRQARDKGKRVLYTVPVISLVDQTWEMFFHQGIHEVGIIQANHHMTDWSRPVQIASIQTLQNRPMPDADVVIIDECHRWFTFYEKLLISDSARPVIGLSATPWKRGLGAYYDQLIVAMTTRELIDKGLLSKFKVYAPTHPDLSDVRTVAGDYHEGELSTKMTRLVGDTVETWQRLAYDRPTLCYAVDRAHAKHLQAKFEAAGVPCGYQDAHSKDHERKAIKTAFHNGNLMVVCNVGTLTTGIDWDVRCISMCRPTKSDMLFTQIVGRGLRTAEGKDHCLILDHSDNHLRLGFVTDIDASYVGLHDGKIAKHANRIEAISLPKECMQCGVLKPPKVAKCAACGFVAQAQCKIKADEGELRQLKTIPKPRKMEIADKGVFYAELKAWGIQHGYKPGWAANQYRGKLGVWPANEIREIAPAVRVSVETARYIKSRAIAWAKAKERASESDHGQHRSDSEGREAGG